MCRATIESLLKTIEFPKINPQNTPQSNRKLAKAS